MIFRAAAIGFERSRECWSLHVRTNVIYNEHPHFFQGDGGRNSFSPNKDSAE